MPKIRAQIALLIGIVAVIIAFSSAALAKDKGKDKNPKTAPAAAVQQNKEQEGDDFKIAVDASIVTSDVTIMGKTEENFQPEDFVIYDEGTSQDISYFSREQRPLAIAILIDASMSTDPYLPILQVAANSALRRLNPDDQVCLYQFNANPLKLRDLTDNHAEISRAIGEIKTTWNTNIWDSLYDASRYLKKNAPDRRRAIILISDNYQYGPTKHNDKEALVSLLENSVTLYDIKTESTAPYGKEEAKADKIVRNMTAETGGLALNAGVTTVQGTLGNAVEMLRKQYTIGFNPTSQAETGKFHKLSVKLAKEDRCPGCRLLTRSGYYSGIQAPAPKQKNLQEPQLAQSKTSEQSLVQRNIILIGNYDVEFKDIPFQATATGVTGDDGKPLLKLDLTIDAKSIQFVPVDDRKSCKLRVTAFLAKMNGKVLNSDWRMLEGMLKEETYNSAMSSGIPYSITTPLKDDAYVIKIVVYDEASDRFGTKLLAVPR